MEKKCPMRQCLGCREMKPKAELVRLVRSTDGNVYYDSRGKLNGRGAYFCKNPDCFSKAVKSRAFERALGVAVSDSLIVSLREMFNE